MRRSRILAVAVATALGSTIAVSALAHGPEGRGPEARGMGGHHGHMDQRMYGDGPGRGGPMGGPGYMRNMMQDADADEDGMLTPDELRSTLEGRLGEFDSDGNGTLSIEEFEVLHSEAIREQMVDRFQHFDNDGDGEVTLEEFSVPADRMERMQQMRERMQADAPGRGPRGGPAQSPGAAGNGQPEQPADQ